MPKGKEEGTPNSLTLLEFSIAVKNTCAAKEGPVSERPISAYPALNFCSTILYLRFRALLRVTFWAQFRFQGNCPPTLPLSHHFPLSEK